MCVYVCVCLCVCVCTNPCVCGKLSQLFSLSIISPSLHNGFNPALNGRECKLLLTLNSRAFTLLTEAWTCDYIKQRGKTIDHLINFQLLLVKRTGSELQAWPCSTGEASRCYAPGQSPPRFLYDASKPLKKSNLNYARNKEGEGEREGSFLHFTCTAGAWLCI